MEAPRIPLEDLVPFTGSAFWELPALSLRGCIQAFWDLFGNPFFGRNSADLDLVDIYGLLGASMLV